MCGIAGAITKSLIDIKIVESIIRSQYLRGPDNSNIQNFDLGGFNCILGHNRLSIIDTTQASNQPFWDEMKENVLIFNGEIYNFIELRLELSSLGYKFHTNGDTEVLLAALKVWGDLALNKLNGMFAFCYINIKDQTALIARDRFGKKPLYYFSSQTQFLFASTPTELARCLSSTPNFDYLQNGLDYWIYESDSKNTQYSNIYSLLGGQYIKVELNFSKININIIPYYSLENSIKESPLYLEKDFNRAKNGIKDLFVDSVKLRLQSDVPVAISLSGGLDSASIAAVAKSFSPNIQGVTLGNPKFLKSEGPVVERLSKYLDIKINYVNPENKWEIIDAFEKCMEAQDSPLLGLSYLAEFLVYKKAHDLGFKVMLGGQGGDEVFMGYRKYHYFAFRDDVSNFRLINAFSRFISLGMIAKRDFNSIRLLLPSMLRYLDRNGLNSILKFPSSFQENIGFDIDGREFWMRQVIDVKRISIPIQLKSEDRNSMANSIETRAPFLDYRLVESGISLPLDFKLKNGFGKWIVREMMKNSLPEEIRTSKMKRGFDVSADWISMGLGDYIRERLNEKRYLFKDFFIPGKDVNEFTDSYLLKKKGAFQEATTLIWLSKFL
jgi:asparagine synthase (glutamine-hydrolysing)